jgi:hypothetical protein
MKKIVIFERLMGIVEVESGWICPYFTGHDGIFKK